MRDFFSICIIGISAFLLASSPQIDASIYKWKDDKGQVHYSQTAPTGVENEVIQAPISPSKPAEKQQTSEQQPTEDSNQQASTSNNNVASGYCKQQQEIIQALKSNPYVKWKTGDKEVLLEGDAKAKQIEEIQADIQKFCSNSSNQSEDKQAD